MARKIIGLLLLVTLAGSGWAAAAVERSEGDIAKVAIGAYRDGFYDVAREELEDFLRRYPASPYAYQIKLVLYLTYLHLQECPAAAKLWPAVNQPAELRQSGFAAAQLLLQLGFCFYQHGDPDEARRYLEKVATADPRTAQAALAGFYLGKIAFQAGDCRRAAEILAPLQAGKNAVLDDGCRRELLYMLALCRYRLADYRRALPLLD
ncbi:MAG: tetratricopeptide repeat protein, partial [Deltaproteobacteria bacterium]|nr:tetratricopeptide repeat protein [Deltaproteobacteria bacterium]